MRKIWNFVTDYKFVGAFFQIVGNLIMIAGIGYVVFILGGILVTGLNVLLAN